MIIDEVQPYEAQSELKQDSKVKIMKEIHAFLKPNLQFEIKAACPRSCSEILF